MHFFKKMIILFAIGILLHLQFPLPGAADTKPAKVTENKPQFAGTAEEYLPGAEPGDTKPSNKKLLWIAAGAVAVLALALGASGGGGGSSGGKQEENQDPGGVEVEW
jgi:hypothetical protein